MKGQAKKPFNESGFSLMELLVVIIILGLISALVAPKFFGKVEKAQTKTAKAQIELLGSALDDFRLDNGRYPTSEEGLKALREKPSGLENWDGPYLPKAVPLDPWDKPYIYKSPGEHGDYDLYSFGKDGVAGGEKNDQDVVSWE
ncbi:pseudopilin, cryptic, general secretion pathway [uncultured Desulfobacterium sp.]|uniref:Type II secretion system core protein G n=1 Tax=uncultured Desulfobacterium sp. TaxID=201089 RepID=A0A445MVU0_9BACT|nr:pseudopilin, cryptic, general secretion pathway [uncultured Desulfobacterium sp.]